MISDIEKHFTASTRELFKALQSRDYDIGFEVRSKIDDEGTRWGIEDPWVIVTKDKKRNPSGLAHELLHIELHWLGFQDAKDIYFELEKIYNVLHYKNLEDINNDLAHLKMVRRFQDLGFKREKFFGESLHDTFSKIHESVDDIDPKNKRELAGKFISAYCGIRLFKDFFDITQEGLEDELLEKSKSLFPICREQFSSWIGGENVDNLHFYTKLLTALKNLGNTY